MSENSDKSFFRKYTNIINNNPSPEIDDVKDLCICFLTIKGLRDQFYDESTNLDVDYTYEYFSEILIPEFNRIIKTLLMYGGNDRTGVNEARKEMDKALKELYGAFTTTSEQPGIKGIQKQRNDRVGFLLKCRQHLDYAYSYLHHLSKIVEKLPGIGTF